MQSYELKIGGKFGWILPIDGITNEPKIKTLLKDAKNYEVPFERWET
jgi:hypothetical protein